MEKLEKMQDATRFYEEMTKTKVNQFFTFLT